MAVPTVRSFGAIVGGTAASLSLPVGANSPGDLAVVYVKGFDTRTVPANAGSPIVSSYADVFRTVSTTEYELIAWRRVPTVGLGATVTVTAGVGQYTGSGWYGHVDVIAGVTDDVSLSPIDDSGHGTLTVSTVTIPARTVTHDDSLVYHVFTECRTGAAAGHVVGGGVWSDRGDRTAIVLACNVRHETFTRAADIGTTAAQPFTFSDTSTTVGYFTLVIAPRIVVDRVGVVARPQSPRVQLGCADSYNVLITDNTYARTIEQVGWSKLRWERVLDDISKAQATIPDRYGGVSCLAQVGGLVPWAYGIKIERNDQEVWRGPVTNVARNGTDIVVDAADVLCRYQKRFAGRGVSVEYTGSDAGYLFYRLITFHAFLGSDPWTLLVPNVHTGVSVDRTLHPRELKYAWDLLSELLDSSVDAYVMNGVLYVWEPQAGWRYQTEAKRTLSGPYNLNYDFVYGTFTEQAWTQRPDWSMDGPGQANYIAVPGIDSSEWGFRRIATVENTVSQTRFGVLDYVDTDRIELPDDVAPQIEAATMRRRADTLIALRAFAPAVITGGSLSAQAPIDVDNLRPGSLWKVDVWDHGFGQLLAAGRLSRVTVDASADQAGIKETVAVTLQPPGWEEA